VRWKLSLNKLALQTDQDEATIENQRVFNAAGRVPEIDLLDMEKGQAASCKKGVQVNEDLQSVTPQIYMQPDAYAYKVIISRE
jgi:glutathione reductase (NADPH)